MLIGGLLLDLTLLLFIACVLFMIITFFCGFMVAAFRLKIEGDLLCSRAYFYNKCIPLSAIKGCYSVKSKRLKIIYRGSATHVVLRPTNKGIHASVSIPIGVYGEKRLRGFFYNAGIRIHGLSPYQPKLRSVDWLIAVFIFIVSWILLLAGSRIPQLHMPSGAAVGISLILASLIALFCTYLWQYKWFKEKYLLVHGTLALISVMILALSVGMGTEGHGASIFAALLHPVAGSNLIFVRETWALPLGISGIVFYVEAWTTVRLLIRKNFPQ